MAHKPKYWDSMFALKVINAFEAGARDKESLKKWHDKYNEPNGTSEADLKSMENIIGYYLEGNELPNRKALEKAEQVRVEAMKKMEG